VTAVPEWHIITCEYPPRVGGVSDYTRLVAGGLAEEGDRVHVWCPSNSASAAPVSGVTVHEGLGKMNSLDLRRLGKHLDEFPHPRRLLVQWVPHGYGYRSMNLPFCLWLWNRARVSMDVLEIMVHEPFLAFGEGSWKQDAAAAVHRIMAIIVLNGATRVGVSIPAWRDRLHPYLLGRQVPMEWLPVPSNVECALDVTNVGGESVHVNPTTQCTLGHFGTFGRPISKMLEALISPLLRDHPNRSLILMGKGSTEFRLNIVARNAGLKEQIHATGQTTAGELSSWIRKCDMMIQPYPDGVSGRRGSAMAALSHGVPIVTTAGALTEPVWAQSGAAALVPPGDVPLFLAAVNDLLADERKRSQMALRARRFYLDRFDLRHTIEALRSARQPHLALCES